MGTLFWSLSQVQPTPDLNSKFLSIITVEKVLSDSRGGATAHSMFGHQIAHLSRCSLGWKDPERLAGFVLQVVQMQGCLSTNQLWGEGVTHFRSMLENVFGGTKKSCFFPDTCTCTSCPFCHVPVLALTRPSSDGRLSSKHHPGSLSLPRPSGFHYPLKNPIAV